MGKRSSILVLVALSVGCSESSTASAPDAGTPEERIVQARAAAAEMRRKLPDLPGLDLIERILREPSFEGAVREWGCVAFFDDAGRLTKACTLKVKDFHTGRSFLIREYTTDELDEVRPQVQAYREELGLGDEDFPIPILSESLKLAVAELVLSDATDHRYSVGRGGRDLQVTLLGATGDTVVAADAAYLSSADIPD